MMSATNTPGILWDDGLQLLLSSEVPHSQHHPRDSRRSALDHRDRRTIRHTSIMVGRVWLVHLCLVHEPRRHLYGEEEARQILWTLLQ